MSDAKQTNRAFRSLLNVSTLAQVEMANICGKNFGGIQLRVLQADAGNFQRFMTQIVFDIVLMEQTNSTFVDVNICIWKIL